MKTTTLDEFQNALRERGAYATADDHRATRRAGTGAWTTLRYTWGVTRVFPWCATSSRRGS